MNKENFPISACGLQILETVSGDVHDAGIGLYSLIDGAKFPGLNHIKLPRDGSVALHSLLGESAQADAVYAGPLLLHHKQGKRCAILSKLLCVENSANFLSLIVSSRPVPTLLKQLTWLTDVKHEDGTEWVMRYYDPLILPHWLAVLDDTQRRSVLAGMAQWLYVDVRAQSQAIEGADVEPTASSEREAMLLSEHQCDDLMRKSLPFMMMSQLESDDSDVLDSLPPLQRYDFFSRQLANAETYGLTETTDLKTYCLLALKAGPDFDSHPLATAALRILQSTQSFSDSVLAWTDEQWSSLKKGIKYNA